MSLLNRKSKSKHKPPSIPSLIEYHGHCEDQSTTGVVYFMLLQSCQYFLKHEGVHEARSDFVRRRQAVFSVDRGISSRHSEPFYVYLYFVNFAD